MTDIRHNDTADTRPLSIAVIGAGNRARKYLQYIIANPHEARLAAIADPNHLRCEHFARQAGADTSICFNSMEEMIAANIKIDAVIIASPDALHYSQTLEAINHGYHVLLEKPIAQTAKECRDILETAREKGVIVKVCYVLHFHPYFKKLRQLIESGRYGSPISISHRAPVGIDRAGHVYVRDIWSRKETSGPLLTSKCCHDLDLIVWYTGSRCRRLASFGSLSWFKAENAPEESAQRCLDCKVERQCPFSAIDLYRRRHEWTGNFDIKDGESLEDVIERELSTGRHGRCVYHCDNDVVDHQVLAMEMESGVSVNFSMDVFTIDGHRTTRVSLTNGEIYGNELSLTAVRFAPRETVTFDFADLDGAPYHAGADLATVADFIATILSGEDLSDTGIDKSIESQRICELAEHSRTDHTEAPL